VPANYIHATAGLEPYFLGAAFGGDGFACAGALFAGLGFAAGGLGFAAGGGLAFATGDGLGLTAGAGLAGEGFAAGGAGFAAAGFAAGLPPGEEGPAGLPPLPFSSSIMGLLRSFVLVFFNFLLLNFSIEPRSCFGAGFAAGGGGGPGGGGGGAATGFFAAAFDIEL